MIYRLKLLAFLLTAVAVLLVLNAAYSALNTISRLDAVEAERDQWQRPAAVLQALNLRPGNVVADLGCGSGYFTLRLSPLVGKTGRVVAEDIRREPLAFLWVRSIFNHESNVSIVRGGRNDPHLPSRVNAVLISNTYHEFTDAHAILVHVYQSLVPSGRLIVLDRAPRSASDAALESIEHEISVDQVEQELRQANFEIVNRLERFVESDPGGERWWMLVARKQ